MYIFQKSNKSSGPKHIPTVLTTRAIGGMAMAACVSLTAPALAANYYISTTGSDKYDGTSEAHVMGNAGPWATFSKACGSVQPGDTVHVLPGTYVSSLLTGGYTSSRGDGIGCAASGSPGKPITFTGMGVYPALTKLVNDGTTFTVHILGSYQTWSNFEMTTSAPVGGPTAVNSRNVWDCIQSTPGGTTSQPAKKALRNITITGNVLHGCGGNGIDLFNTDYISISKNVIYDNAHTTTNAYDSGITILGAADADTNTGYKIVIDSNIVYNNINVPNCAASDTKCLSKALNTDGNGIILDSSDLRYDNYPGGLYPGFYGPSYHGRTLVENNLVFGNGGKCIHSFRTKHVDVINNTCYNNLQDPYYGAGVPGEIDSSGGDSTLLQDYPTLRTKLGLTSPAASAGDERVYNNSITNSGVRGSHFVTPACIAFSFTNQSSQAAHNQCYSLHGSSSTASYDTSNAAGVHNSIDPTLATTLYYDPGFVNPNNPQQLSDYEPTPISKLVGGANNKLGYVAYDIRGVPRSTTAMTLGAYEH